MTSQGAGRKTQTASRALHRDDGSALAPSPTLEKSAAQGEKNLGKSGFYVRPRNAGGRLGSGFAASAFSRGYCARRPAHSHISSTSLNVGTPARSMLANHSALPGKVPIMLCSIGIG